MILKNKYCFGLMFMWYEIEMLEEHIDSCIRMLDGIDNPDNVRFHFCINQQEYLEKIDPKYHGGDCKYTYNRFFDLAAVKLGTKAKVTIKKVTNAQPFFNIARFRRTLNFDYCEEVDYIGWSETDSLWPEQTLQILEALHAEVNAVTPKFLLTFAYRRNWDQSWDHLVHPMFQSIPFVDTDDFVLNNEASEKSYMSPTRMGEINAIPLDKVEIASFDQPKADGSCLVMSADLIKSGVNIPHGIIHNAEDISFCEMAKLVMGDEFVQYHVRNILRVHNRRHPRKRSGILNENNPSGFCDDRKGQWWKVLETASNSNYRNLRHQLTFAKVADVIDEIQKMNNN